jgi:hypothetical protein
MTKSNFSGKVPSGQDDSWQTGPPFDSKSLEEEVEAGDAWEQKESNWTLRVSINRCPQLVKETLWWLKRKHSRLTTGASVTRYVTRAGIKVIQQMEEIKELREKHRQAYLVGDELTRMRYLDHRYDFGHRISHQNVYLSCWVFNWVDGAISDIADDVGLPASTMAVIALIAGLAQSVDWVPERHRQVFERETIYFWRSYLKGRIEELNKDITS